MFVGHYQNRVYETAEELAAYEAGYQSGYNDDTPNNPHAANSLLAQAWNEGHRDGFQNN